MVGYLHVECPMNISSNKEANNNRQLLCLKETIIQVLEGWQNDGDLDRPGSTIVALVRLGAPCSRCCAMSSMLRADVSL